MFANSFELEPEVGVWLKRSCVGELCSLSWSIKPYIEPTQRSLQASTWVKLVQSPSPFSFEEALLLCPYSPEEWVVWIPDHGEAVVHISDIATDA